MLKRLKTVSMMLFLLGASTRAAIAVTPSGADDVKIAQQSDTATGTVVDNFGPVTSAAVVVKGTTNGVVIDFDDNSNSLCRLCYIGNRMEQPTVEGYFEGKSRVIYNKVS